MSRLAIACALLASSVSLCSRADDTTGTLLSAQHATRALLLSGFTRARARVRLVAEAAGRVDAVALNIGDRVPEDGHFASIDDTFINLELKELDVEQERLRTQIEYDRRDVTRYTQLASKKNASASKLDALEQALRDNRHQQRLLDVKRQTLDERRLRTEVRAPSGWRIIERRIEPYQWVSVGEEVGAAADFSTLIVPFALTPQQHQALVASADDLHLALPDLQRSVTAEIYRVNPGFDPSTRKIAVDLAIKDDLKPNRGGLRVELELKLPERDGTVLLPPEAVELSYEEHWVTREDGQRLPVVVLGETLDQGRLLLRVTSPEISPGERFRKAVGD